MLKENYISNLSEALKKSVSKSNLEKIIEYYEQYFNDSMDAGISELDISKELGNPEILAREILAGMTLNEIELFSTTELVRMVDVSLIDMRVHLVFNQTDTLSVTYQGNEPYNPDLLRLSGKSNHLNITQKASRIMPWLITHEPKQNPYLLIEVPYDYKGRILIKTRESRIIVDGKDHQSKVNLSLQSKNGKIDCRNLKAKDIEIRSESGKITLNKCEFKNIILESHEGVIDLDKCKAKIIEARNNNNRIDLDKCQMEIATILNAQGRIAVTNCYIDDCRLETDAGRVFFGLEDDNCGLHLDLLSRKGKIIMNGEKLSKGTVVIKEISSKKKKQRYFNVYARTNEGKIDICH